MLDAFFHIVGLFNTFEEAQQLQREIDGEAQAAARRDIAVGDDALGRADGAGQLFFPAGIAGRFFASQEVELSQDARAGADRGEAFALAGLLDEQRAQFLSGQEIFDPLATSGDDECIAVGDVTVADGRIGRDFHPMGREDFLLFMDRNGLDIDAAAAQDIDDGEAFYLFHAVGHENACFTHDESLLERVIAYKFYVFHTFSIYYFDIK